MQIPIKVTVQWEDEPRHGNFTKKDCRTPPGETDQYKDQSKDILNSILKEELADNDSEALIEEVWTDEVLLFK